jgi:hypothetical protein
MSTRRGSDAWTARRRGGANGAAAHREGERRSCKLQRVAGGDRERDGVEPPGPPRWGAVAPG